MKELSPCPFDQNKYWSYAQNVMAEAAMSNRTPDRHTGSKLSGLCHPVNFALALDVKRNMGIPLVPFAPLGEEDSSITMQGVSLVHCARGIRYKREEVVAFHTAAIIANGDGLWYLDASASQFGLSPLEVRCYSPGTHQSNLNMLAQDGIYTTGNEVDPSIYGIVLGVQQKTDSYKRALKMYDSLGPEVKNEIQLWATNMGIDLGTRVLHTSTLPVFLSKLRINGLNGVGLGAEAIQALETLRESDRAVNLRAAGQIYP